MQQVKAGLKAIYLSGWQVAGDANSNGEMYPDQSLYSVDSVPKVVKKINNTFARADQIQWSEGKDDIDYFAPIVADAEAGFGGVLNAFELMKAMIDAGAAGVHFEDQLASVKKCGHMGGKVLVPTREAVAKLVAARLAADVMGTPTILLARTDAEAADLVTSDVDENDKPFLTGERTVEGFFKSKNGLEQAISRGLAYAPYADLIWCETGKPDLAFAKAFADAIHAKFPGKLLAYNCSPSFNWKKNLDDATIAKFQRELGAMGYKFQFITLAGFHSLNYSHVRPGLRLCAQQHERLRRTAGEGVRRRREGLHRREAPARGRHGLLRRRDDDDRAPGLHRRAEGLHRRRTVLRRHPPLNRLHQVLRLLLQALGGGGTFFHQGGVLLRHLVHLADGLADLRHAAALLAAGGADLAHDVGHAPDRGHHLLHGAAGLVRPASCPARPARRWP
jgi:2-methylisocitrate lyase-like PEP mutase family enzyme